MRFKTIDGDLPVLWHQSFLSFATRYKNDVTEDQRDALLDVLQVKGHPAIAPETRRELVEGRARGEVVPPPTTTSTAAANGSTGRGDDDLMMDI